MVVVPCRRRHLRVGRAGERVGVAERVAVVVRVLLVVLDLVGNVALRRPDRRVGAVALRHRLGQRGRPAERVARLRHRQRGLADALAPAPGGNDVRLARVLKGQGIGIARVVDAQHGRAVRGDGAALDRALVLRILMVARNGLHGRFNGRAGRAGQVLGLRGGVGIAAVRVLEVVFDLVRRILSGLPLGIEGQAAHRHRAAGKGVLTRRVGVPAAEHIAGLDRLRQRGEAHARAEVHLLRLPAALRQRSAVRLKPEVAACAVVVQLHDGLAIRADRRRGHGAAIHLRVIVGEAVLAPRAEVDRGSGRAGPALDGPLVVDEQIALHAVHTLRVALDAVRRVVARQPLRRKGHVARDRHAAALRIGGEALEALKGVALQGKRGRVGRAAVLDGINDVGQLRAPECAVGEGHVVGLSLVIDPHHGAAVRLDGLLRHARAGIIIVVHAVHRAGARRNSRPL